MSRPLSPDARAKALAAARELVFERGIEAFTVAGVAARSGVAKTTIYRHWPDAHSLLIDSLHEVIEELPTPNTGSLHDDLLAFFERVLPVILEPGMRSLVIGLMQAAMGDPEVAAIHDRMLQERQNPVRTILQLAIGRGELPADLDISLAIDFLEGPLFRRVLVDNEKVDPPDLEQLIRWAVAGLTLGTG